MKRYEIKLRWRSYRWTLQGVARDSATLVIGLLSYFGPDAGVIISVRRAP